jgi:hypothetical protein
MLYFCVGGILNGSEFYMFFHHAELPSYWHCIHAHIRVTFLLLVLFVTFLKMFLKRRLNLLGFLNR